MRPEDDAKAPVRGIVRYVRLHQTGHFMMGDVTIAGHELSLSGTYGADGLIKDVPREVYEKGVELPKELYNAWRYGGGWNEAGSEGPLLVAWAQKNLMSGRKG